MAKIIDPDDLTRDTEVIIDPTAIPPQIGLEIAGNLSTDGVSLQALYSFCKEQWKTEVDLIKYPFPIVAITPEQFEFVDDWIPSGSATIELFRDAGFAITSAGSSTHEYIGAITLGDVDEAQIYYSQVSGTTGATNDFVLTGAVNQCVVMYEDSDNGDFDYRDYFKVYAREYARIYGDADHGDIGVTTFTYQAYRFPLANSDDLKVTHVDDDVDTGATWTSVDITYYTVGQSRSIGGSPYYFDRIIEGDSQAKESIYEKIQYLLRQTDDIDEGAGTVSGKTAELLLSFVGDTLVTKTGVYIDNFATSDTNAIEFYDTGGTQRLYPFVAAGTISWNDNLTNDANGIYMMFFTSANGNDFGTAAAITVEDNSSVVITGETSGSSDAFDFDYDGNVQGGRSSGTDAPVTLVAIGYDTAQYVKTTSTITRTNANNISLVAALERNYSNPA